MKPTPAHIVAPHKKIHLVRKLGCSRIGGLTNSWCECCFVHIAHKISDMLVTDGVNGKSTTFFGAGVDVRGTWVAVSHWDGFWKVCGVSVSAAVVTRNENKQQFSIKHEHEQSQVGGAVLQNRGHQSSFCAMQFISISEVIEAGRRSPGPSGLAKVTLSVGDPCKAPLDHSRTLSRVAGESSGKCDHILVPSHVEFSRELFQAVWLYLKNFCHGSLVASRSIRPSPTL